MLRGVNRGVIEICDTGNEYFEKALLFVKPAFSNSTKLEKEAYSLMGSFSEHAQRYENKHSLRELAQKRVTRNRAVFFSLIFIAAALITLVVLKVV